MENRMKRTKDRRANESLNTFTPRIFGTITYQAMYAGSSQKYTNGWPKNQNKVRLSSTSMVSVQPNAQGMYWKRTVATTPRHAMIHMMMVVMVMKAKSGLNCPLLFFRHTL